MSGGTSWKVALHLKVIASIGGASFVIQDLEIIGEPLGRQTCHNGVICCNEVAVALGFEGLLENEVAVGVEGTFPVRGSR
jgi:hypothetical protein